MKMVISCILRSSSRKCRFNDVLRAFNASRGEAARCLSLHSRHKEHNVVKPSFDYRNMLSRLDELRCNISLREADADVDSLVELHGRWSALKQRALQLRHERNEVSATAKTMYAKAKKKTDGKPDGEPSDFETMCDDNVRELADLKKRGKLLKESLASCEEDLAVVQIALEGEAARLPNWTHPDVPVLRDADGQMQPRVVFKSVGKGTFEAISMTEDEDNNTPMGEGESNVASPRRQNGLYDHVTLAGLHDLVDLDSAHVVSGSGFWYLKNEAALLELALQQWAFQRVAQEGFSPFVCPDLVRSHVVAACGFRPRQAPSLVSSSPSSSSPSPSPSLTTTDASHLASQIYSIADSDLALAGTAEVPMCAYHYDSILSVDALPHRCVALGTAYRQEGSAHAHMGMFRGHQFKKVELFAFTTPESSESVLDEIVELQKSLFSELGLYFRVIDMPCNDLGASAYRKFDIESWLPAREVWCEISSASNCTDYQARRMAIRYRRKPSSSSSSSSSMIDFVHTVNGTACAVPRTIISILEQFQLRDGRVEVPTVLRPFLGGHTHIPFLPR